MAIPTIFFTPLLHISVFPEKQQNIAHITHSKGRNKAEYSQIMNKINKIIH